MDAGGMLRAPARRAGVSVESAATRGAPGPGRLSRRLAMWLSAVSMVAVLTALGAPAAVAVVASPIVASTPAGTTSVVPTAGKARGSGLWGFAGDVRTQASGGVFNYDLDVSPTDGSLWVSDSAKVLYTSSAFLCTLSGGVKISASACLVGESRLSHYPVVGTDWGTGQYLVNGAYSVPAAGSNAGVGANYAALGQAQKTNGSDLTNGRFGGIRGLATTLTGDVWAVDADYALTPVATSFKGVRVVRGDFTEGPSFGKAVWSSGTTWTNRNDPESLDYPVGAARMLNGDMIVTSQTPELLKQYKPDGTFVRNISLHQPAGTAGPGDAGYRSPYAVAVDPTSGDLLVGYIDPGNGNRSFVERIATTGCTTEPTANPAGSSRDLCPVKDVIGWGDLATGDGQTWATFAIAVEPRTGDVYVSQRSGQVAVFASDGTYRGRFSAFGGGTGNGQVATVRGMVFDARGFLYATVSEGTANARVEIFARTPDPITGLSATYTDQTKTAATLTWNPLAEGVTADSQAPLKDYVIEQSVDGGTTWSTVPTPANTTAHQEITGLDAAKQYVFRVSAWNEAGNGDTATAAPTPAQPGSLTLVKAGNGQIAATSSDALTLSSGSTVTFTYTVTNNGPSPVTGITVNDSVLGAIAAPAGFTGSLGTGDTVTFTASGAIGEGSYHNEATATGTSVGVPVAARDDWYAFGARAAITVTKSGDGVTAPTQDTAQHVTQGSVVPFTYLVTNTGNVPVTISDVLDDKLGSIAAPQGFSGTLAAGASVTYTSSGVIGKGPYKNTVTVSATAGGSTLSATDRWFGYGDAPAVAAAAASSSDGALAATGAPFLGWIPLLGGALVLLGAALFIARSRRA